MSWLYARDKKKKKTSRIYWYSASPDVATTTSDAVPASQTENEPEGYL